MGELKKGDYVLATKWSDGDPRDHWCIGYYTHTDDRGRYYVIDGNGKQFRGNGFRRIKKIKEEQGKLLLHFSKDIELSGRSVWGYLRRWKELKELYES